MISEMSEDKNSSNITDEINDLMGQIGFQTIRASDLSAGIVSFLFGQMPSKEEKQENKSPFEELGWMKANVVRMKKIVDILVSVNCDLRLIANSGLANGVNEEEAEKGKEAIIQQCCPETSRWVDVACKR